jgi:hypothetical protein
LKPQEKARRKQGEATTSPAPKVKTFVSKTRAELNNNDTKNKNSNNHETATNKPRKQETAGQAAT